MPKAKIKDSFFSKQNPHLAKLIKNTSGLVVHLVVTCILTQLQLLNQHSVI